MTPDRGGRPTAAARRGAALSSRRGRWVVIAAAVAVMALLGPLGGKQDLTSNPTAFLPATAQSTRVVELERRFAEGQTTPAIVVFAGDRRLGGPLRAAVERARREFAAVAVDHAVSPVEFSSDDKAALVVVPLSARLSAAALSADVARLGRLAAAVGGGLHDAIGGPAGYIVDLGNAFSGIDGTLLLATILVVAFVLILTYRSPFLWLVPLLVIGFADQAASAIVYLLARYEGLVVNGESSGILRVLVFGAGTDYALLLIARYREGLRQHESAHEAMTDALRATAPSVIASAATVTVSLLVLGVASSLNNDRSLGFVGAIGIVTALVFALLLLPAVLVLFGRRLFWPFVPHLGEADRTRSGPFASLGRAIARRPVAVLAACAVVLGLLGGGIASLHTGLTSAQQFRNEVGSVRAERLIEAHFPAGASATTYVVARRGAADAVADVLRRERGIASATIAGTTPSLVEFSATLSAPPDSAASYATIRSLRVALATVRGSDALVGGSVATDLDTNDAAGRDRRVVIPIVLLVVLAILILLLRSLVGPLLLIGTVVVSYLASLGASALVFTHLLGYPAVDSSFPLLAFLFLVAFGVDYNIFLSSRAREETARSGPREGALVALAVTGGVITSAGIVLAATFGVLTVLPLLILTQLGIVVAIGVLLDTVVVRSVVVPALMLSLGGRFWWPSALGRRPESSD